jgi:uncharacterized CHY-type Zn-finger protein
MLSHVAVKSVHWHCGPGVLGKNTEHSFKGLSVQSRHRCVWKFFCPKTVTVASIKNCGVFTPCKNCNIETSSHDYATVDEAVFSPRRAEVFRAVMSRASPCLACCQATTINTWILQEWWRVMWPRQQRHHAFQQRRNNWSTGGRSISHVLDHGFIGETEARLRVSSWWKTTVEGS